jgi:pyruvate formate lyase activating enzyme
VSFEGVGEYAQLVEYVGRYLLVARDDIDESLLPEEVPDIAGFRVVDAQWGELGTISEILENAYQATLVVQGPHGEVLIPLVDEFFADFKCADPERHREITGVSNERIKEHLKLVLHEASNVTIRTPLIPDYTASIENISAIAAFLAEQKPAVHYELLNYNELAPAKYPMTGRVYEPGQKKRFSEAEMEVFRNAARNQGLTNVI